MTGFDDDRSDERVREDTIDDLLDSNNLDSLQQMRREMREELDATDDGYETDLLEYRLSILDDAIDRANRG
jgi:hypothetical protein